MSVYVLREAEPHVVMRLGIGALVVGVAITLLGLDRGSTTVFFLGTGVAGVGFGSGFQGSIRTVMPLPLPHERAGVLSVLYVVSYLGMGLPAVIAGVLVVQGGGLVDTAYEYGFAVIALAVLAATAMARSARRPIEAAPAPERGPGQVPARELCDASAAR